MFFLDTFCNILFVLDFQERPIAIPVLVFHGLGPALWRVPLRRNCRINTARPVRGPSADVGAEQVRRLKADALGLRRIRRDRQMEPAPGSTTASNPSTSRLAGVAAVGDPAHPALERLPLGRVQVLDPDRIAIHSEQAAELWRTRTGDRRAAKEDVRRRSSRHGGDRPRRSQGQGHASGSAGLTGQGGGRTPILRQIPARHPSDGPPVVDLAPARMLRRSATLVFLAQRRELLEGKSTLAAETAQAGRVRGDARERRRRRRRLRPQCHVAPGRDAAHAIVIGAVRGRLRGPGRRDHHRSDGGKRRASAPSRRPGGGPRLRRRALSRR
jgi:hypothetical protein